ncbi:MAG: polymer-forming cytoskeletal protein [Lachnospiraceae bacterium]|nr:polymer-forming cytoskeletal protein [Lachnospiraceae bacterium]
MNPYDETSNKENLSSGDDIVSENMQYMSSSSDDLFDIIEPKAEEKASAEESDFVQDADFVNSLDFINGFEDIEEAPSDPEIEEPADVVSENVEEAVEPVEPTDVESSSDEDDIETEDVDDYDDLEDESLMIVTEGTTITGSIGTDCSLLVLGTVNGDITCEGKLTISGKVVGNSFATDIFVNSQRVEGNIGCTGTLKVSQGTVIIGDITAGAVAIGGAVKGNLDVKGPVILDSTAVIKGNIKAKSVQLINGAVLEGFCSLEYSESQIDEIFNSQE